MSNYYVDWDVTTRRPIVDGKITNPNTGIVEPAGIPITYGPPTIDAIWHNMKTTEGAFTTVRMPTSPNLDKRFIRIARHVESGVYSLISVNATTYSFNIICESDATSDEFFNAVHGNG